MIVFLGPLYSVKILLHSFIFMSRILYFMIFRFVFKPKNFGIDLMICDKGLLAIYLNI
jgi:hypothetical protein